MHKHVMPLKINACHYYYESGSNPITWLIRIRIFIRANWNNGPFQQKVIRFAVMI